ncbi:oligosaccharide flippase family protein [Desulfobacterales bacterium HSG2]|nr:oligosaccharide flippase family protein [Desulfobacterales bacterium HSG2]
MAGVSYISFTINFCGQVLLARMLVPEDFGTFALAMSISEILFMIGGFGLAMACISLQNEPEIFNTAMVLSWLLGVVLLLLGVCVCFGASFFYNRKIVIFLFLLCVVKVLQVPSSIYSAQMEKNFLFRRVAVITGMTRSSAVIIAVMLGYASFGPWSLLVREILSITLLFAGMLCFSKYTFRIRFDKQTALKIWQYAYNMFFMRISEVCFSRMPVFFLGTLGSTNFLGLFERSFYIAQLPNTMLAPFSAKVGFALYSKLKQENEKISEGLYWSLLISMRILFPIGLSVYLFPDMILKILFGEQWAEAGPFLRGFALFLTTAPLWAIVKHALLAKGYVRDVTIARIISIIIVSMVIGLVSVRVDIWYYVPWSMSAGIAISTLFLARKLHIIGIRIRWMRIAGIPMILGCCLSCLGIYLKYRPINPVLNAGIILTIWTIAIISLEYKEIISFYRRITV